MIVKYSALKISFFSSATSYSRKLILSIFAYFDFNEFLNDFPVLRLVNSFKCD